VEFFQQQVLNLQDSIQQQTLQYNFQTMNLEQTIQVLKNENEQLKLESYQERTYYEQQSNKTKEALLQLNKKLSVLEKERKDAKEEIAFKIDLPFERINGEHSCYFKSPVYDPQTVKEVAHAGVSEILQLSPRSFQLESIDFEPDCSFFKAKLDYCAPADLRRKD